MAAQKLNVKKIQATRKIKQFLAKKTQCTIGFAKTCPQILQKLALWYKIASKHKKVCYLSFVHILFSLQII